MGKNAGLIIEIRQYLSTCMAPNRFGNPLLNRALQELEELQTRYDTALQHLTRSSEWFYPGEDKRTNFGLRFRRDGKTCWVEGDSRDEVLRKIARNEGIMDLDF